MLTSIILHIYHAFSIWSASWIDQRSLCN